MKNLKNLKKLNKLYETMREDNHYCYFEVACTRKTDYMAFICSNERAEDPNRIVLLMGQGSDLDSACKDALKSYRKAKGGSDDLL